MGFRRYSFRGGAGGPFREVGAASAVPRALRSLQKYRVRPGLSAVHVDAFGADVGFTSFQFVFAAGEKGLPMTVVPSPTSPPAMKFMRLTPEHSTKARSFRTPQSYISGPDDE